MSEVAVVSDIARVELVRHCRHRRIERLDGQPQVPDSAPMQSRGSRHAQGFPQDGHVAQIGLDAQVWHRVIDCRWRACLGGDDAMSIEQTVAHS